MMNKSTLPDAHVPRVSIGLPIYNGERYVRQALDSLLAQTWSDFEIIISDNCSTDKTAEICQEYAQKDARIRYVRTVKNNGAVANFNSIVALAKGQYFKWAAHDDMVAPTYLERCVAVLDKDPSVVLCHSETELIDNANQPLKPLEDGRMHYFDKDGKIIYLGVDSPTRKLGSYRADERFAAIILQTDWVYEIFGVFRIGPLKRTGLMKTFYGGDKLLLAQIVTMGRIVVVPEKLFLNRRHTEQSMSQSNEEREAWVGPISQTAMQTIPTPANTVTIAAATTEAPVAAPQSAQLRSMQGFDINVKEVWESLLKKAAPYQARAMHLKNSVVAEVRETWETARAKAAPYQARARRLQRLAGREGWELFLKKAAPYLSRVQRMKGFFGAALGGEMSYSERIGCLKIIANYYFRLNRWHDMLEDITGIRHRRLAKEASVQPTST
jgi:Glycosyl transferase family 2